MPSSLLGSAPRSVTRAEVLRILFKHTALARHEIADYIQLTGATISRIVTECIEAGLIVELPASSESGTGQPLRAGRRPVPVTLNPEFYAVAGIHIGLLWLDIGLFDLRGRLISHRRERRHAHSPADLLEEIGRQILSLQTETRRELLTIGVSLNGQVTPGVSGFSANNVLGWPGFKVQPLESTLNRRVIAETDTYAMALAEFMRVDTKPDQPLLLVNVGTSIGMGIVVNRSIMRGRNGLVGFIEHLPWIKRNTYCPHCGRNDCLTNAISDRALLRQVGTTQYTTIQELLEASRTNAEIRTAVNKRAQDVGKFLGMIAVQYDPGQLVLAGSCLLDGDQFNGVLHSYEKTLGDGRLPNYSPIKTPQSYRGELLPLIGAGTVALDSVFSADLELRPARLTNQFRRIAYIPPAYTPN